MKGKAKNLSVLKAPKNPHKVKVSMNHVGGWPTLKSPRTKKGGRKGARKRSTRKA
jgi:hypothetical protein